MVAILHSKTAVTSYQIVRLQIVTSYQIVRLQGKPLKGVQNITKVEKF